MRRLIRGPESQTGTGYNDNSRSGAGGCSGPSKKQGESTCDQARNPTDVGFSLVTTKGRQKGENWERLEDEGKLLDGEKVIWTEYTYGVETGPGTSIASDQSKL